MDNGDRFANFHSIKQFLNVYHSEGGVKGALYQGEKTGAKEDNFMNEWFNNLNQYIESNTNMKYSLRQSQDTAHSNDKKEILFTILMLNSIINFRENELIEKSIDLKHLSTVLRNRIKN